MRGAFPLSIRLTRNRPRDPRSGSVVPPSAPLSFTVENHHGRGGAARQTAIVDRVDRTGLVPREQIEGVF